MTAGKMATQKTFTTTEIIQMLSYALILLQDKSLTVHESERYDESPEAEGTEKRVSLADYIVRAVAEEMVEHFGETDEGVKKAIQETKIDFDEIVYPNQNKTVGIYNDIR